MKRLIFIVLTLIIPMLFFVNVWQGFRYERMKREVSLFESEQKDWLEKNKKLIAALAVFRSPGRIERIAESKLGLKRIDPARVWRIILPERVQQSGE